MTDGDFGGGTKNLIPAAAEFVTTTAATYGQQPGLSLETYQITLLGGIYAPLPNLTST